MFDVITLAFLICTIASAQVLSYGPNNLPQAGARNVAASFQIPNPVTGLNNIALNNAGNLANAMAPNKFLNGQISNVPVLETGALYPNNIAASEALNLAALAQNNLASVNGNVATFNLGGDGHTFTVTSGSPGSPGFNIQVAADALEVGGTVSVNGQIPIYGTVSVNGNVPTDGSAAVNYSCGSQTANVASPAL